MGATVLVHVFTIISPATCLCAIQLVLVRSSKGVIYIDLPRGGQ